MKEVFANIARIQTCNPNNIIIHRLSNPQNLLLLHLNSRKLLLPQKQMKILIIHQIRKQLNITGKTPAITTAQILQYTLHRSIIASLISNMKSRIKIKTWF